MPAKRRGTGVRGHRLNPNQSDRAKAGIQATQIVKRLNSFALQDEDGPIKMSKQQVSAAMGLLRKVIPDLQTIDGSLNHTIQHEDVVRDLQNEANGESHVDYQ